MLNRKIISSLMIFGASICTSAFAATATSNMTVSANVSANCTISAGPLAFGAYDPIVENASVDLDGQGTLSVVCTSGSTPSISLDQGLNADSGSTDAAPQRRMTDGSSHYLSYTLYSDESRSVIWGKGEGAEKGITGTGVSQDVTVYGAVTKGQNVPAGNYSDTVVATITF